MSLDRSDGFPVSQSTPIGMRDGESLLNFSPSSLHFGSHSFDKSRLNRSCSESDLATMSCSSACYLPIHRVKSLKQFLMTPKPPYKEKQSRPKSFGRVLTSRDNIMLMEEREKQKQAKAREKEERKLAREEAQRKKLVLKEEKSLARKEKQKCGARRKQNLTRSKPTHVAKKEEISDIG